MRRHSRKLLLLFIALGLLSTGGATLAPEPAEAWATCKGGSWSSAELKCYLGIHTNCSECWVVPDK